MGWYALASYRRDDEILSALVLGERLFALESAASALSITADWVHASIDELLQDWMGVRPKLDELAQAAANAIDTLEALELGSNDIAPPLRPTRIFCAAANYASHAREMGTVLAEKTERHPYMFMKPDSAIIGHNDTVILPNLSSQVDWEIELAAVIGKSARYVSADEGLDYVAGYSVINDTTARDLQWVDLGKHHIVDWLSSKCLDRTSPLGPAITSAKVAGDPHQLKLTTHLNETIMQDSNTSLMVFSVWDLIEFLSARVTLLPGDVLATGTPFGVGSTQKVFLKPGDTVRVEVENVGVLENQVEAG